MNSNLFMDCTKLLSFSEPVFSRPGRDHSA
jgi:hypothetical protein